MRRFPILFGVLVTCGFTAVAAPTFALSPREKPNFIVVFCDNLGNGDVRCFNPETPHRTPNLDRMAAEGRRFTSFYSTSGVCTPSRASLITSCYPRRVNLHVSDKGTAVLQPVAPKGLHPDETTIAEVLKSADYATTIIGKWHLGDQPVFLPTRQGFDHYFGIPYSDDMTRDKRPESWPPLPLMRDEEVIEAPVDRDYLTQRYTEEAIRFLEDHRDRPFFLYLPQAMPGSTRAPYASPDFKGKSANGNWGDSIEELDWSMGEILAALKRLDLEKNTLVVWTSDNGAPNRNPPQGSNAPYEGPGYTTTEGGMRMPTIMRWPGTIPAGTECRAVGTMMDFLPTFAKLAGAALPEKTIDGHDILPQILGEEDNASPYDEKGFFYYQIDQLQAVRSGPWKLYLPLEAKRRTLAAKTYPSPAQLFNVREDFRETEEVAARHPDIVKRLQGLAEQARTELGDVDLIGAGQREAGWVDDPKGLVMEN
jgi:arylsulfatase A-like enzyme